MTKLNVKQAEAIARARRALVFITSVWPDEGAALVATACAGGLVDLLNGPVAVALVEVVNAQWQGTPWRITRRPAN